MGEIYAFLGRFRPKRLHIPKLVRKSRLIGQCGKLDIVGTHMVTVAIDDIG